MRTLVPCKNHVWTVSNSKTICENCGITLSESDLTRFIIKLLNGGIE